MATIETCMVTVNGVPFKMVVRFDPKRKTFAITLPEMVALVLKYDEVRDNSFDAVKNKFKQALSEAEKANSVKTKVILFQFQYIAPNIPGRGTVKNDGMNWGSGERHIRLDIWVGVFEETQIALNGKIRYVYELQSSSIPPEFGKGYYSYPKDDREKCLIPWSEEREAFFTGIIASMNRLIDMIDETEIAKDGTKMLDFIEKGLLLLPGPSSPAAPGTGHGPAVAPGDSRQGS